jgi:Na+:H+ antiporter, NhaA family
VRLILRHESAAGVTLLVGVAAALLWSGVAPTSFQSFVTFRLSLPATLHLHSIREVVTQGILTFFFFSVGLELSREMRVGQLRTLSQRVVPFLAAAGGMAGCAIAAVIIGRFAHLPTLRSAWGVPMATDIAFTLGALSLVPRVHRSLRLFLLALAIADDLLSVIVLAISGHHTVALWWCIVAVLFSAAIIGSVGRSMPHWMWWVILLGLWWVYAQAGIEPCLAGVAVGVAVRFGPSDPGPALEKRTLLMATWFVLPSFALVACGVTWHHLPAWGPRWTWAVGLLLARLLGKMVGILSSVWLLARFGWRLPDVITPTRLAAASLLCAIGVTVPLIFAGDVFGFGSVNYQMTAVTLMVASVLAAGVGIPITARLWRDYPRNEQGHLYEDTTDNTARD